MKASKTMQDYKVAGAWLRLCQEVISRTWAASSDVLKVSDSDRFETMEYRLKRMAAEAENGMIKAYPESWYNSSDVFFGTPDSTPQGEIDAEQIQLMKSLIVDMFGDNWNGINE